MFHLIAPQRHEGRGDSKNQISALVASLRFLCSFVFIGVVFLVPGGETKAVAAKPGNKADRSDAFFADRNVRTFHIDLTDAALTMLKTRPRVFVHGGVKEGGNVLTNIGVHLKGMGSFRRVDEKPSFVLKFDEFTPDQEYCGLTKLMLNNSVQDRTYLAELLATDLFRDAAVPAARVTHARVFLNGEDLGLYVAIEAMNKRFLKRYFKNTAGNLYEGYLRDIDTRLDQDNGEDTSQKDVRALFEACRIADPAQRFERLTRMVDVERFANFAAMEMLTSHWDGYTLHTNNYRFYHDPESDKIVFITHGLDAVFRRQNVSVTPPMKSAVSRALFQTVEGRTLYEQGLRTLYTNVFRLDVITNRMENALAKLRAAKPAELAEIERNSRIMRDRIQARITRVGEQLSGIPPKPLEFDRSGLARITNWREEFDRGEPVLDRAKEGGKTALHIKAAAGTSRASWRSMIFLKPGRYRFEGEVRSTGVTAGGAGLRISGDTRNMRIGGDSPWQSLQHDFKVEEQEGADVELVCEFHAATGEAWYALDSLRVRKL
jgi:hypothetical protein